MSCLRVSIGGWRLLAQVRTGVESAALLAGGSRRYEPSMGRETRTFGLYAAIGLGALGGCNDAKPDPGPRAGLTVTSSALQADQPIPAAYACTDYDHLGRSPPLSWTKGPAGTVAYAVTMTDPDAKGFVHWALVNVPA